MCRLLWKERSSVSTKISCSFLFYFGIYTIPTANREYERINKWDTHTHTHGGRERDRKSWQFLQLFLLSSSLRQVTRKEQRENMMLILRERFETIFIRATKYYIYIYRSTTLMLYRKIRISYKRKILWGSENSLARNDSVFLSCMIAHPMGV